MLGHLILHPLKGDALLERLFKKRRVFTFFNEDKMDGVACDFVLQLLFCCLSVRVLELLHVDHDWDYTIKLINSI
jgi:hypothetical protein